MKDLFDVSGKVALVTVGSRGIGEMIAEGYVANGVKTYISSSKAAVHHLTRTLASHLADRHITCNAIAPGLFPSHMTAHIMDAMGEKIVQGTPMKRHCRPEDMAGVAIYLASKAASFVSCRSAA